MYADWGFNDIGSFIRSSGNLAGVLERYIHYLFHVNDIERFTGSGSPVGNVSSERLTNWIMNYDRSFRTGYLPIPSRREISNDLFTNTIDNDRLAQGFRRGRNRHEIDAGDTRDLRVFDESRRRNFWSRLWNGGAQFAFETLEIRPIEELPEIFPTGTTAEISRQLFVNYDDVAGLRNFHAQATENYETVFMFRFAVTDYMARWLTVYRYRDTAWWEYVVGWLVQQRRQYEGEMYKAQQTVFFDFDIISLTFYGEFGHIVIPVVMDPIDIIPDITPPAYDPPSPWDLTFWFMLIVGLLLLMLLLLLIAPFLPLLAKIFAVLLYLLLHLILLSF